MTKKTETSPRSAEWAEDAATARALETGIPAGVLRALSADPIDRDAVVDACLRAGFNAAVADLFIGIVSEERRLGPIAETEADVVAEKKQVTRHLYALAQFVPQTPAEALERADRLHALDQELRKLETELTSIDQASRHLLWLRSYGRVLLPHLPPDEKGHVNTLGGPPLKLYEWFNQHGVSPWFLDSWKELNQPPVRKRRVILRTVEQPRKREPR